MGNLLTTRILLAAAVAGGAAMLARADRAHAFPSAVATASSDAPVSVSFPRGLSPDDISYDFLLGIHPKMPISLLRVAVGWINRSYLYPVYGCAPFGTEEVTHQDRDDGAAEWTFDFGSDGLRESRRLLACGITLYHDGASFAPQARVVDALDLEGNPVDTTDLVDLAHGLCMDCASSSSPVGYPAPDSGSYDTCDLDLCGDVVENGNWTVSDARLVLGAAIGLPKLGFTARYDVDGDGQVDVGDARKVLRRAVGLPVDLFCSPPPGAICGADLAWTWQETVVTFRLDAADAAVGALDFLVDYGDLGDFVGTGPGVHCTKMPLGALFAANDIDVAHKLMLGLIHLDGIEAPADLASCTFSGWTREGRDLRINVYDAADVAGNAIAASVSAVAGF